MGARRPAQLLGSTNQGSLYSNADAMSQEPSGLAPASAEPARKDALEVIQDAGNDVVILEDEHAKRTANWCASQLRAVSRPGLLPPRR